MSDERNIFDAEYVDVDTQERRDFGDFPENRQLAPIQQPVTSAATDLAPFIAAAASAGKRDVKGMVEVAKRVGQMLGRSAFYSFPAGGGRIEGPTIDLAYALSIEWGRCISRCLLVSTDGRMVTLRGQYIDLVSVTIVERDARFSLADAPAKFANKPDQIDRWRAMQEQAAISKAVRGAILGGLPVWFVDAALVEAHRVAESDLLKGKTIAQARTEAIGYGGEKWRLTSADLEGYVGQPVDLWTVGDLDRLRELFRSLAAGRLTVEGIRLDNASKAERKAEPTGRDALKSNKPAETKPKAKSEPPTDRQPESEPATKPTAAADDEETP